MGMCWSQTLVENVYWISLSTSLTICSMLLQISFDRNLVVQSNKCYRKVKCFPDVECVRGKFFHLSLSKSNFRHSAGGKPVKPKLCLFSKNVSLMWVVIDGNGNNGLLKLICRSIWSIYFQIICTTTFMDLF